MQGGRLSRGFRFVRFGNVTDSRQNNMLGLDLGLTLGLELGLGIKLRKRQRKKSIMKSKVPG